LKLKTSYVILMLLRLPQDILFRSAKKLSSCLDSFNVLILTNVAVYFKARSNWYSISSIS